MDWFKACLLICSFVASCESANQHYFVITPNVIRFNHPETVLISIFGDQKNVQVSVWLQHRGKQISLQSVTVPNEKTPVNTTVQVTEADLFDTVIDEKPRLIQLCSNRQFVSDICKDVVISYKTGYLILQTDKPIYTPRQKVKIRVLALDESLKTVTGDRWPIFMDIVSPSNLTLGRKVFSKRTGTGFYQNSFNLPPYPEHGTWTARAFYGGQYETTSRSLFQVEEYVLPTFGVTVDASKSYILKNDSNETKITFTVIAKYVYGKPVVGKARLSLNATDQAGDSIYIMDKARKELQNGIVEFGVKIGDIFKSNGLKAEDFPDGSRLGVVATIFESATGKEESTLNDDVVFAREPYIFEFTRSKLYFRPGMEYYFKIDMFTPNNEPVVGMKVKAFKLDETDQVIEEKEAETDAKGQALAIFATPKKMRLIFKVMVNDFSTNHTFEAIPYDDINQIQVERIITDDNVMLMNAFSNVQLNNDGGAWLSYTGMLFVVVTRGKVVHAVFKEPGNKASEIIEYTLQKLITPSARLLVFYVDKSSDRLVADSIKIDVDAKCSGEMLSLAADKYEKEPGKRAKLTITGTPNSWVGLNVMDKALLLLNDKNVMVKNKMFDALRSHDLGCGEGSGKNNGDVFKNAGLLVLTDASVTTDLHRASEECNLKKRRKRSTDECIGADRRCCDHGKWYAEEVLKQTPSKDEKAKLDSYTLCYAFAKRKYESRQSPIIRCAQAIFNSCRIQMDFLISKLTLIVSKSLEEDVSLYEEDFKHLDEGRLKPHKRKDFRESFLFEEVQLDVNGNQNKEFNYPDSITEWMVQAIGITENDGMCIADPINVTVFRDFFIQLNLPYKATRFELFDLKATLFSYGLQGESNKQANIYLTAVNGLCYGTEPGKPSPRRFLEVGPNTASTIRFPMIPLKEGTFDVKITAIVTSVGVSKVDIIEKPLYVVNEGIQEIITIQVCLDPYQQREDCEDDPKRVTRKTYKQSDSVQKSQIDLALPNEAIQGTGSATAYLQGNIMDNVVQTILSGVDSLFRCPHGCGEQTIATTAPNVYAMMYLKQTKQVTEDIEVTGNSNIRDENTSRYKVTSCIAALEGRHHFQRVMDGIYALKVANIMTESLSQSIINNQGVNREKSMFRHSDGSYSCCNNDKHTNIYRATSVWLTAFVAKVFCHAKTVVDDLLDEQTDLHPTINFLKGHMNAAGMFTEIQDTRFGSWLKGATESGNTPSLTAFVLISLLECNIMQSSLNRTVDLATRYLESLDTTWLKNRPFDLAITTYALALAKSNQKEKFKNLLESIQTKSGKNIYWANPSNNDVDAYSIETTAYALLAMLKFNDMKRAGQIVRWLTSQQNAQGVFKSTQDTVVGLQALSQYSIRTYSSELDLKVSFSANKWKETHISLKNERFDLQHMVDDLPVEKGDSKLDVFVTGTSGSGRMRIELRYNRPAKDDEICPFEISKINVGDVYKLPTDRKFVKLGECDVCGNCVKDSPNPDYTLLTTPTPINVTIVNAALNTQFGRRKREAVKHEIMANQKCIRFSVRAKPGHQHGMSMIYFNLETDVTVLKEDMDKVIRNNDNLDNYEMPTNSKGFIVFYLNTLTSQKNEFVFRLFDDFEGDINTRQPVSVDVFDYYDPDKYCRKIYGIGPNKGAAVDYKCDSKRKQCRCLKNSCSTSVDKEIIKMTRVRPRKYPAVQMSRYTCNVDKANFADIVSVSDVRNETGSKDIEATAKVKINVHQGGRPHDVGTALQFFWRASCPFPKLEKGKQYLIIAKDGFRAQDKTGNDEYRYSLMETAIVIEYKKTGRIRKVIDTYRNWMRVHGCMN